MARSSIKMKRICQKERAPRCARVTVLFRTVATKILCIRCLTGVTLLSLALICSLRDLSRICSREKLVWGSGQGNLTRQCRNVLLQPQDGRRQTFIPSSLSSLAITFFMTPNNLLNSTIVGSECGTLENASKSCQFACSTTNKVPVSVPPQRGTKVFWTTEEVTALLRDRAENLFVRRIDFTHRWNSVVAPSIETTRRENVLKRKFYKEYKATFQRLVIDEERHFTRNRVGNRETQPEDYPVPSVRTSQEVPLLELR